MLYKQLRFKKLHEQESCMTNMLSVNLIADNYIKCNQRHLSLFAQIIKLNI